MKKEEIQNISQELPENRNPENIQAQTPEEQSEPAISEPYKIAAGIGSITATMKYSFREMGVWRTVKTLTKMNQKGGFDCQSCAWIDPDGERTIAEFCENGAKAMASEGTRKRITREFFAEYSVAELSEKSDHWHNEQGRLTEPMILRAGKTHYEPVSWDEAFSFIARELNALDSPDEAVFYTSGRTSNEAAFLYQLFVRQFGTNNLPDCSNMCHESTSFALKESIGLGKATVKYDDFEKADLIIIMGQNPGTNHPRMMNSLQDAKRNGARIIAVNPLPEAGLLNFVNPNPQHYKNPLKFPVALLANQPTKFADLFLPVRVGGDMAFLKGVMKHVLQQAEENEAILDFDFIGNKTSGFAEFKESLDKISWEIIIEQSGLSREEIAEAAEMFIASEKTITCWAMGITQHKRAVGTIQDIANLHFLRGQIGKPGAGLCPVRGHSNVQGDRTVGIWEKMPEKFLAALDKEFNFTSPREHGLDTVNAIKAMHDGRAKIFFAMGGNFLSATPDTEFTAEALQKCRLTVQVLTKLNRSAIVTGENAVILPCLGRSEIDLQAGGEQLVSTESTSGVVQSSKGILEPASKDLRSEPWIVANLAKAVLGAKTTVDWDSMVANYDNIRASIERVVEGFENYNERVREPGGFYLPNKPRNGEFSTDSGKAVFKTHDLDLIKLEKEEFILTTIRAHNQFNTTVYDLTDRYRGVADNRHVVFMNEQDIAEFGFSNGQKVDLTSDFEGVRRTARNFAIVPYPIPRRCAAAYFPEANVLVPVESTAEKSNCPTSKAVIITIAAQNEKSSS
jgi:molybdopterin-dependent oxidoreductase alpha subunit